MADHRLEEEESDVSQNDIDQQIRRESTIHAVAETEDVPSSEALEYWRLPPDLDPEWMALEVYTESEDSSSEDSHDINEDSAYVSHRPSSSGETQSYDKLAAELASLKLETKTSPSLSTSSTRVTKSDPAPPLFSHKSSPFGPIRTSLSLLEMLIRLTALQQFQQASHLAIPDELLTFFLEESSTTGGDGDERRRTRHEARRKVGFDPYDESPIKRRGEDYQYQSQNYSGYQEYSRQGTPYDDYDQRDGHGPSWLSERNSTPQRTPQSWLLRSREGSNPSPDAIPDLSNSLPVSPYQALSHRVRQEHGNPKIGSPLGRGMSVEIDSTLGTSPGLPTVVDRNSKGAES